MAPRKKKVQQKVTTGDVNATKNSKTTKKTTKRKTPVKKITTRKPRQPKKSIISPTQDNFESLVENDIVNESDELAHKSDTLAESNECSSVECETSLNSQITIQEDSTYDLTEQLEHLEVHEQDVMEELIEFDSVDNVVTVDYVSQEVTLEAENDNSNVGPIDLAGGNDELLKEEEIKKDDDEEMNKIDDKLSEVLNKLEVSQTHDSIQKNEDDNTEFKTELQDSCDSPSISEMIETDNRNENETTSMIDDKLKDIDHQLNESENRAEDSSLLEDIIKIEKTLKSKSKKQNETKSNKTQKKETKKDKSKATKAKTAVKTKNDELDDGVIRRSSRIKSISVLKKPSVGHGLVKVKECEVLDIKNEIEKAIPNQIISCKNEPSEKPIKVKSRWRRSSELEMNVSNSETKSNDSIKENLVINTDPEKVKINPQIKDELVENRLKQFVHLKENIYLTERFVCKEAKKMTCDCFLTEEEKERGEMACGEDCLNRLLMIECGNLCQVGDRCANKKFQKSQFAPVEVFNTHKKGLGLRAAANIPYGEFILEYVGEVLNADEFDRRADVYSQDKNTHYYFMSLRSDAIIDATQKGNISRFINHSCEPNAETQKWTVNGELRIGFFSTRTILAGEEVTFDYRFERYGKEAQKCYCEAPSCRGWLGEEPDEDEECDDEEDEEVDETAEVKPVPEAIPEVKPEESSTEEVIPKVEKEEVTTPIPVVTKVKKTKSKRKLRKELFEDDQLDEEIDLLVTTGLKNQAHTLKLSRLMIRAKEPAQRGKLLRVLRRGELPCRRLFLDYHGLRLMHGYMTDAQHLCQLDKKYDSLRLEVLQTLAVLPVPNKTMLQDSKVLATIEKWSVPLTSSSSIDSNSESNSPKVETEVSQPPTPTPGADTNQETMETDYHSEVQILDENQIRKSVGMQEVKSENSYFKNTRGSALAEEIVNIFEDDLYLSSSKPKLVTLEDKTPNYEFEIIILATKLVEMWSKLKEVFRIPKKERIEQMKEHEREANRGYIAGLGLEQYAEKKNESRYRGMQKSRLQDKKNFKSDERNQQQTVLSKYSRRKLFALQVEQQEEDRRRKQRELWIQHEKNCMLIGTDPRFTAPFDPTRGFQCIWNPQIGQWQNYPIPPSADNPLSYGHMANMAIPASLPNTNIPPPHIQSASTYPYGMSQIQMSNGMPAPMPPLSTGRNLSHMVPPIPVGRPPMTSSLPPTLLHQIPPTSGTMSTNIHQGQAISSLPPVPTNMPPPTLPPQTPPPLPGVQGLHNPMGYSPQMMIGQTQSPVLYQQEKNSEIISIIGDVKFLGPIPPPPKLPPKWKSAKDKYGRPYYYHIRIRKSQWEPPALEPSESTPEEDSDSSSSESTSSSSDSSSDDSDSDEEIINDSRLLRQVKKQISKEFKIVPPIKTIIPRISSRIEDTPSPIIDAIEEIQPDVEISPTEEESSIDKRLKEQFNLMDEEGPSAKRRKNSSLVQEIIISPRTEEDKLLFKEDLKRYKENKLMLKKQKEIILQQRKKHLKEKKLKQQPSKAKIREMKYSNTENAKKIKEAFRSAMANTVVTSLNVYRKSDCKEGRITNTEDFKHLARKLTHFVMLKEMKHISEIEELVCSESVKVKAKDFIRKYMSKFGEVYVKRDDEPEHYY